MAKRDARPETGPASPEAAGDNGSGAGDPSAPGGAVSQPGGGVVPPGEKPNWTRLHLWEIQGVRDVLVGLAIFGLLWLGYKLSIVTVPILLAMTLAYLFEPVVRWLTRPRARGKPMSREAAASLIIGSAVLLVVVPLSLGLVFGVAQGIRVAGRVAEAADHVDTIITAQSRLGSPFDQAGAFKRFTVPPPEPQPGGQAGETDDVPESAAAESGDEASPEAEASTGDGQTSAASAAPPDREQAAQPKLTDEQLAARANSAWAALGQNFSVLRDALGWTMRRLDDEDQSLNSVIQWTVDQLQRNSQVIAQQALGGGVVAAQAVIARIISFGMFLFMLFLTAFFFYFFCTGYGRVLEFWRGLIPEARKHRVVELAGQMDAVIAGFIRGRLTIAAIQAVFFTIAYWAIGVPAPLIIGPIVAVLSIVPYVALVGIPITVIGMLIDPPSGWQAAWWWILAAPTAVYFAGQALDDYILTPLIQGKSTDMATPSILFASIAGGALAGLYGLLLAIPVAACIKILLREVFWPRFRQWAEGRQRDFLPISGGETDG